jgi:hypothetical protein
LPLLRVLLIGAAGVFGSRLAELLARERNIHLILAGRTSSTLEKIAGSCDCSCEITILDRNLISADNLRDINCHLVIDAAGPFQTHNVQVIEAAIAAGVHYIDLADGRVFVKEIVKFDAVARSQNVAVITGASSIPALSHAVIDSLSLGWLQYDDIRVGIFPGNRAPRGLSVVESILSYVGKPVRVFRQGQWQDVYGWGLTHRAHVPFVGKRWASVCDTPDQDLLVSRYKPTKAAEFFAGLELSVLHLGLLAMSFPVRWRLIDSLAPLSKPMLWLAQKFLPFGSDNGGMTISLSGIDSNNMPVKASWALKADTNRGPYVPTLAALALVRKFRDGSITFRGASACVGILKLEDFDPDFERLEFKVSSSKAK